MINRLKHARAYADSTDHGDGDSEEKRIQHFALLAIANALIALVEQMRDESKRHKSETQVGKRGKREMNTIEVKTMKSGKHKNLRWVNGTRWLVWRKKKNVWKVYDRKHGQQKHRLVTTEDEAEAVKWLLYQEEDQQTEGSNDETKPSYQGNPS